MLRHFDEELQKLKECLLSMAGMVEDMIRRSTDALAKQDVSLAGEIIKSDDFVDAAEIEIDEFCLKLLALRQPIAADLRFITMVLKINNDLERIGDLAVNICENAISLSKAPLLKPLIDIPRMSKSAQEMIHKSLDSFVNGDVQLADEVRNSDKELDGLRDQIMRELLVFMMADPSTIEKAIPLLLVARHLERIGDLATNIAEDVIYMVEGRTAKHLRAQAIAKGR